MNLKRRFCIVSCSILGVCFFFGGCKTEKKEPPLFKVLDYTQTGLDFSNNLTYNQQFNLFKYIYFYNGSGIGAGDFNNDGLIDLFFGSNQQDNKLYLNTGSLHFSDVTKEAKIPEDGGWTTGISVVDINNDGLLDLYVCRVGNYETLKSKNQLLVCQGIDKNGVPYYLDKAAEYGLNFSGFSTQAAFFDYDMDGDLDMFLLNHSVHENGTFRPRSEFLGTYHALSGDRFYRNDGGKFTEVTRETGINSSAIGYGLGIAVADVNLDGYPDIYIGNDFHENDYLYINQRNGTFKELGEEEMMHSSQFSMGVDVADINNDAYPEIISMDMLPSDPYILKRSLGEDSYDIFKYKISVGYAHQYTRNNLQLNRRQGTFSEGGLYSGIAATDWSWASLWMDFDNDGLKDLFISNGIPKRMNDIDYINFVSNNEVQLKIRSNNVSGKDLSLINKFPEIKLPNKFYRNKGGFSFSDEDARVDGSIPTFSNGAAYADLDNDGDLDIVVNNIDAPALIYENKSAPRTGRNSVEVKLKGPPGNINAVGAKLIIYTDSEIRTYEKFPVKGFMSSMEIPLLAGTNKTKIDSMFLVWPDNSFQALPLDSSNLVSLIYQPGLPVFNYQAIRDKRPLTTRKMIDITASSGLTYVQQENHFIEFDREPLIPHMLSTEGPALAVADVNHDGLEDIFIGSARNKTGAIFLQQSSGKFMKSIQPFLDKDNTFEDVDACWTDVNNDGEPDLVIASGGNEFYGKDPNNSPRVYLNNGKAVFSRLENAFDSIYITASSVAPCDFNKDGYIDLFLGGRAVPWEYGKIPQSYLLQNDGTGRFKDVTADYAPEISSVGFVTQAVWFDIDKDGDNDLLLALEWGGICTFLNEKGKFRKQMLTEKKGWWNFILPYDIDNDGDIDLVAGNLGLNSRLTASSAEPVKLYYNDFDDNGKKEQVITYYLQGKEIPFSNKAELEKQIPLLKKKFLYAADFAKASLTELLGEQHLRNADVLTADYFANAILVNQGNLVFKIQAMPALAQLSPFKTAAVADANGDGQPDILLFGNYYDNNIQMGRYDADFGTWLINKGNAVFDSELINGLTLKGQVRKMQPIRVGKNPAYVLGFNSDSARIIRFE